MTAVDTLYGSFSADDLKAMKKALDEASNELSIIDQHKEAVKDIINAMHDLHKIPKKVLSRMIKVHHKQTFQQTVAEDNEFEALYIGMTETK